VICFHCFQLCTLIMIMCMNFVSYSTLKCICLDLFSIRSQKTSKCGKNTSDTLSLRFVCRFSLNLLDFTKFVIYCTDRRTAACMESISFVDLKSNVGPWSAPWNACLWCIMVVAFNVTCLWPRESRYHDNMEGTFWNTNNNIFRLSLGGFCILECQTHPEYLSNPGDFWRFQFWSEVLRI